MAKMKFTTFAPDNYFISEAFSYDLTLSATTKSMAVFEGSDVDQGSVVFDGKNLSYRDGKLVGGIVTKVTFEDALGNDLGVINHLQLNFPGKIDTLQGIVGLLVMALEGDDMIVGSRENDHLFGGAGADIMVGLNGADQLIGSTGNDRMTGSLGSDSFFFEENGGRDTIVDFDAVGGGTDQDYIMNFNGAYIIIGRGDDTVIDFGDGDKVILLDVLSTDVSSADIGPFVAT